MTLQRDNQPGNTGVSVAATSTYLELLFGNREGFVAVAVGSDPYWNARGTYSHRRWQERRYRWPDDRVRLLGHADDLAGLPCDVYVAPALRTGDQRSQGGAAGPLWVWVDLDQAPADADLWETLRPIVVHSGQPGHAHGYVPLTRPVDLGTHAQLGKALAARLGGDAKWSDESLLRLPGTYNHKCDPPGAVAFPTVPDPHPWDPADLAEVLGVVADAGPRPAAGRPPQPEGEPIGAEDLPQWLLDRLGAVPEDRSAAFHGLVGACHDAGLSQGQTVTVMASWEYLPERFANRVAVEVARSWSKLDPAGRDRRSDEVQDGGGRRHPDQYFAKEDGLLAVTLAKDILGLGPLAAGIDNITWSYSGGVWSPDRYAVRARTAQLLGERYRPSHTKVAEDVVAGRIPTIACDPVSGVINFRNGLYDWTLGRLREHDPDVPTTVQLQVPYDPDATCPTFDRFLAEIVPADMITPVWELIGYLLYSGNPLHKAVMFVGKGRNGKGTLIRVILALLGQSNVTTVSLQDLVNTRFRSAQLFGKIANIAGDIDGSYLENTALFKAITGGDTIQAEHKNRDPFDFTPWAVPLFSANKIPAASDTTAGYLSRWFVVPFPHSFEGREDRTLDDKLADPSELAGVAAKAVRHLPQLLARGDFELGESAREAKADFTRKVDQVRTWYDECCAPDADRWNNRTHLYGAYKAWCARDGYRPVKAGEFYDRLEAIGMAPAIRRGSRGYSGCRVVDSGETLFEPSQPLHPENAPPTHTNTARNPFHGDMSGS